MRYVVVKFMDPDLRERFALYDTVDKDLRRQVFNHKDIAHAASIACGDEASYDASSILKNFTAVYERIRGSVESEIQGRDRAEIERS